MPRKPREKSKTGIFHVMFRGINGQVIFEDDEERARIDDIEATSIIKRVSGVESETSSRIRKRKKR